MPPKKGTPRYPRSSRAELTSISSMGTRIGDLQRRNKIDLNDLNRKIGGTANRLKFDNTTATMDVRRIGEGEQIREVTKSVTAILDKLGLTIAALSRGIVSMTATTAAATKEAIQDYGRAISEDIRVNKRNFVSMAITQATPVFGYFVSKLFETQIFRTALEKVKGKADQLFRGLAERFKRSKQQYEDTYFEETQPMIGARTARKAARTSRSIKPAGIGKTYTSSGKSIAGGGSSIRESTIASSENIVTTIKLISKTEMMESRKQFSYFTRLFNTRLSNLKESGWMYQVYLKLDNLKESIDEMEGGGDVAGQILEGHPILQRVWGLIGKLSKGIMAPIKWLFSIRGGYRAHLPKSSNTFANINDTLGLIYTRGMVKLDAIISYLGQIGKHLTGRELKTEKEEGTWTVWEKYVKRFFGGKEKTIAKEEGKGGIGGFLSGIWNSFKNFTQEYAQDWAQDFIGEQELDLDAMTDFYKTANETLKKKGSLTRKVFDKFIKAATWFGVDFTKQEKDLAKVKDAAQQSKASLNKLTTVNNYLSKILSELVTLNSKVQGSGKKGGSFQSGIGSEAKKAFKDQIIWKKNVLSELKTIRYTILSAAKGEKERDEKEEGDDKKKEKKNEGKLMKYIIMGVGLLSSTFAPIIAKILPILNFISKGPFGMAKEGLGGGRVKGGRRGMGKGMSVLAGAGAGVLSGMSAGNERGAASGVAQGVISGSLSTVGGLLLGPVGTVLGKMLGDALGSTAHKLGTWLGEKLDIYKWVMEGIVNPIKSAFNFMENLDRKITDALISILPDWLKKAVGIKEKEREDERPKKPWNIGKSGYDEKGYPTDQSAKGAVPIQPSAAKGAVVSKSKGEISEFAGANTRNEGGWTNVENATPEQLKELRRQLRGGTPRGVAPSAAAGGAGGTSGPGIKVKPGVDMSGLNPNLADKFSSMAEEGKQKGIGDVTVNSAYRSQTQQAELYKQDPFKAAPPGKSLHEKGLAIDINSGEANKLSESGIMQKHGLYRPMAREPWHLQMASQVGDAKVSRRPISTGDVIKLEVDKEGRVIRAFMDSSSKLGDSVGSGFQNLSKTMAQTSNNISNTIVSSSQNSSSSGRGGGGEVDMDLVSIMSGNLL